ncbi:MAG: hypothetical protein ACRBBW_13845 [Cellvibrionaceae bacterium]
MTTLTNKLQFTTKTGLLSILLLTSLVLIFISEWMKSRWQLELLDGIWDPAEARSLIEQLSSAQVIGHLWFTTTIDVILPLAVVATLTGVTLKAFTRYGKYLAIPALAALPLDLSEGVIQVLVLTNTADLLNIKAYTSPLKIGGYLFGLAMLLLALIQWLFVALKTQLLRD